MRLPTASRSLRTVALVVAVALALVGVAGRRRPARAAVGPARTPTAELAPTASGRGEPASAASGPREPASAASGSGEPAPAAPGPGEPALVASGRLELVAEPQAGVGPFLTMIAGARHSLELTMYELTDRRVETALAAAAHRGVDVRVALNGAFDGQRESTNDAAARYLSGHGVHVRFTPSFFALTHQKTLTVDGRRSAIMTLNLDGRYASTRDFAVIDAQPADVRAIVATFDADWAGRRTRPSPGAGDLVWSPGAGGAVLAAITSARKSIALEDEEMDDPAATADLCAAARRGVHVTVVMTAAHEWYGAFDRLARCGVALHVDFGQRYYIHAKVIVTDDRSALVTSQNLSPTSLDDNRELGIRITAAPLVHALADDVSDDAAGARRWTP